jgi:hypoxanthine phosphoribosyltransferase
MASDNPNPLCECVMQGYCSRHKMKKNRRQHELCSGNGGKTGLKYFLAWEQGKAGANQQEKPATKKDVLTGFASPSDHVSTIGTVLETIIEERGAKIQCGNCRWEVRRLNMMTKAEAKDQREELAAKITESARTKSPKLYQRIAATVDHLVSSNTPIPSLVHKMVLGWVDESIENGEIVEACEVTKVEIANRRRSAFSSDKGSKSRFITASQFQQDIKILSGMIPSDITAIVGIARSGLSAATMISMYRHLPLLTIRQSKHDVIETGNGWRLGGNRHIDPSREKVVIVDDTVMTGNSLKAIKPLAKKEFGSFITASVYVNPLARVKPDIHAVDLPWAHLLEWNLFNSVLSPNMAVDFDGILCFDCRPQQDDDGVKYLDFINNAKPLYPARKVPIPLIVTARIEKYRKPTEQWLKRHGIRWKKLVMHPAKTLRERRKDDIAAYKAKHFMEWAKRHRPKPPPLGFIESDDHQAKRIHQISKRMVICPSSGKVYD